MVLQQWYGTMAQLAQFAVKVMQQLDDGICSPVNSPKNTRNSPKNTPKSSRRPPRSSRSNESANVEAQNVDLGTPTSMTRAAVVAERTRSRAGSTPRSTASTPRHGVALYLSVYFSRSSAANCLIVCHPHYLCGLIRFTVCVSLVFCVFL